MKCIVVEEAVARMFGIRENFVIVPNVSWGLLSHECDLLVVRKSGYAIEVEIKASKSDLKKDASKRHGHNSDKIKELYFAVPDNLYEAVLEYAPIRAGIISVAWRGTIAHPEIDGFAQIRRPAVVNKMSRALTNSEMTTAARLGTMRIWGLKAKLLRK